MFSKYKDIKRTLNYKVVFIITKKNLKNIYFTRNKAVLCGEI